MRLRFLRKIIWLIWIIPAYGMAQPANLVVEGGIAKSIQWDGRSHELNRPVLGFDIGDKHYHSGQQSPLVIRTRPGDGYLIVTFENPSRDTLKLHNVVPLHPTERDVYITGLGSHRLSRTHLFRPGRAPVNVIVPDNAWELGFIYLTLPGNSSLYSLSRRDEGSITKATRRRFETWLQPGGSVSYRVHTEVLTGNWQAGLTQCFQTRKLHDLTNFDESLYRRKDLQWIRGAYVMHLMMAWDKDYYDASTGTFNWPRFVQRGKSLYGGDDVICLWPTWPSLGLDPRNQFDLYRDLPGGLPMLRTLADTLRKHGTKFFIAYNPWDESTRAEGHLEGLASLIRQTSADGVVLDTKGESSLELQKAADNVRPGVIMYSEGMAVPRDMPGIVSGRVHNALYYPPMLNLNKLIRPDFAIFRVAEVFKEPILREYALSLFNGYGTEINQFAPGHPEWEEEQYLFLGRTSRILRENTDAFSGGVFTPLIDTHDDQIWVNRFSNADKNLYTVFSLLPQGFEGPLMEVDVRSGYHWVDLWKHESLKVVNSEGKFWLLSSLDGFNRKYLGTNNEGQVTCIAELPNLIQYSLTGNSLKLAAKQGTELLIWAGAPDYSKHAVRLPTGEHTIDLHEKFGRFEGKVIVQLFAGNVLRDEAILQVTPGSARKVSRQESVFRVNHEGMVRIPAGTFPFKATHGDNFIPYPEEGVGETYSMPTFWMDKFPVTNKQFQEFLNATGYRPADSNNFLRHWDNGKIPKGQENFPVVYVSWEDAHAFSRWAGKRLPSEIEWQYAAQTSAGNEWPWKQARPVVRREQYVTETLTTTNIEGIDPRNCNLGDGKPYEVGKYARGVNPNGLFDLVGCVWQLTADVYESGSYRCIMMKGGSYFKPSASWWYVQGGPRELHYRQQLLRVSPGFERNATVGFRLMADAQPSK